MSGWFDIEADANVAMLSAFGATATLTPQDGSGGWLDPVPIVGVDTVPGGNGPDPSVVWFWATDPAARGDRVTYKGTEYFVEDLKADTTGNGITLKLRAT